MGLSGEMPGCSCCEMNCFKDYSADKNDCPVFRDGKLVDRVMGLAPREELLGRLDYLLGEQK